MNPSLVFLSLGSNLGDRADYLRRAREGLVGHPQVSGFRASAVYETVPVGPVEQGPFLNQVVEFSWTGGVRELFVLCRALEQACARERRERWGPRTLDVDILLFGHARIAEADLEVPHPRMTERAFVMVPLAELRPQLRVGGRSAEEWVALLGDAGVRRGEGEGIG